MTTLHDMTVAELAQALKAKQVSAVETAQHFIARSQADMNSAGTGSFLAMNPEATLAQAAASDARIAKGTAAALEARDRAKGGPTAKYIPVDEMLDAGFSPDKPIHLQLRIQFGSPAAGADEGDQEHPGKKGSVMLEVFDACYQIAKGIANAGRPDLALSLMASSLTAGVPQLRSTHATPASLAQQRARTVELARLAAAGRHADRLSINIELPTAASLQALAVLKAPVAENDQHA